MTCTVKFRTDALREWQSLDKTIRMKFASKLKTFVEAPFLNTLKLHGISDCYKIKLPLVQTELIYQLIDDKIIVAVVSVDNRERNDKLSLAKRIFR